MKSFKSVMLASLIGFGLISSTATQSRVNYLNALGHAAFLAGAACAAYASYSYLKQYNVQQKHHEASMKFKEAFTKAEPELNNVKVAVESITVDSTDDHLAKVEETLNLFKQRNPEYIKESGLCFCIYNAWKSIKEAKVDPKVQTDRNKWDYYYKIGNIKGLFDSFAFEKDVARANNIQKPAKSNLVCAGLSAVGMLATLAGYYIGFWRSPIFIK